MSTRKNREVNIRFLRQGLIKASVPENFEQMTKKEKLNWANEVIESHTDDEIIQAMSDFENPEKSGFFDSAPLATAIEKTVTEPFSIVSTQTWDKFLEND